MYLLERDFLAGETWGRRAKLEVTLDELRYGPFGLNASTTQDAAARWIHLQDAWKLKGKMICMLAIAGMRFKIAANWLLGDTFFHSFNTVFDYGNERIGLARVLQ